MPVIMRDPDFSSIIQEPVERVTRFPDVHSGQASDVWLIQTVSDKQWIVRASRFPGVPDIDFWVGCHHLFGIDPSSTDLSAVHARLHGLSQISIPRIDRSVHLNGRWFFVVELLPGKVVRRFSQLPHQALRQLGASMASIHSVECDTFGRLDGQSAWSAPDWPNRLIETMELLVQRYYIEDARIQGALASMCESVRRAEPVVRFSPIMLDLDPTQFISDGRSLTGLVDLEVYAYGPAEFELCMLEYLIERDQAAAFYDGYTTVRPFPNLHCVRPLYRYLGLLLAVQGRIPYEQWMNASIIF